MPRTSARSLLPVVFVAGLGWGLPPCRAADPPLPPTQPVPAWAVGDGWEVEVTIYPRQYFEPGPASKPGAGPARPPATSRLTIRVAGVESVGGAPCWQLDFAAKGSAASQPYRLLVRQSDGWPCRAVTGGESRGDLFEPIGPYTVMTGAPVGFPLELLPLPASSTAGPPGAGRNLLVARRDVNNVNVQEIVITNRGKSDLMFKQVWVAGEKWWREYERFYRGGPDLKARLVNESVPLVQPPVPPAPPTPARPGGMPDSAGGPVLQTDPRLRATLRDSLQNPPVNVLLDRLSRACRVELGSDLGEAGANPLPVALDYHDTPVWVAMEQLAKHPQIDGRWEAAGTGYRLISRARGSSPDPQPPVPASARLTTSWLAAGLPLVLLTVILVVRRRVGRSRSADRPDRSKS